MDVTFIQILMVTLWAFVIGIDQFNGIPSSEPLEIMAGDVLPYLQGQSGD